MDYMTWRLIVSGDPRGKDAIRKRLMTSKTEEIQRLVDICKNPPADWLKDPEMRLGLVSLEAILRESGHL
jgi:hypothetical protein